MNLVEEKQRGWIAPGLRSWPLQLIKHFANTNSVVPNPAGLADCRPLYLLHFLNLSFTIWVPNRCCIFQFRVYQSFVCNLLSTPRCESQVPVKETWSLSCFGRNNNNNEISEICLPQSIFSAIVIPDILPTERFPKFADAECIHEWFVCVSNAPKLSRSSCKMRQSCNQWMFLYVTQSSANRRSEDLILSVCHLWKLEKGSVPKTDPYCTQDKTGLTILD